MLLKKKYIVCCSNTDSIEAIKAGLDPGSSLETISFEGIMGRIEKSSYDYLFMDLASVSKSSQAPPLTEAYFQAWFNAIWRIRPSIGIIVLATADRIQEAILAVRNGAKGYLKTPLTAEEIRLITQEAHEDQIMASELDYLREQFWEADVRDIVRTQCDNMNMVYDLVRSVAPTRTTVLMTGETGTGKSLLAKLIHRHSNRREAQFISIHCGAIPDALLESELFGHEKGAFTGAVRRKLGKFEIANGGTIFLDEIGTLTSSAQVKLLMVLQEGLFERVGGEYTLKTDVRVVAATNSDLKRMTDEGLFRKDLFYRLNVFPIDLPPLRERYRDIPQLVENFLEKLNGFGLKTIQRVHPSVTKALQMYAWPGNIRELENLIERAYILEQSDTLTPESLPSEFFEEENLTAAVQIDTSHTLAQVRAEGVDEIERRYLKDLLTRHKGRINLSAEEAGITTRQLHKLMKKYGYHKESFKSAH
jgi:DNA-binding NtrC family response regulator